MPKPNGNGQAQTPFSVLRERVLKLSQASSKAERMTRIKSCFDAVEATEKLTAGVAQELGHLMRMVMHVTGGTFQTIPFKRPPGTKMMRVVDAKDVACAIASAREFVVLVEPKHVLPLSIIVTAADDTESRVTIAPPDPPPLSLPTPL